MCTIKPTVLQCEGHPFLQQDKLRGFCEENDILLQAYSPLGAPQLRVKGLGVVLENEEIKQIANELKVTPADFCIRFQIDRGVVVIPKSVTPSRIKSNFEVWGFKLSKDQLSRIAKLDRNHRYVLPTKLNDKGEKVLRDGAHPHWPWFDTIYPIPEQ